MIEQMNKRDERKTNRRYVDNRNDSRDYEDNSDEMDYYDEMDSRRGVKGSGRSNRTNRRDYEDWHMQKLKLTKADLNHWKHSMQNTDGTQGEHYDMQQVIQAAEKLGVRFREYDEREFCVAVNMIYSDYGHIIKRLVQDKDKELLVCADFAKAFFDDPDGPEPSEKLAIVYHCMTDLD
jgi:hypothetical protein